MEQLLLSMGRMFQETGALSDADCSHTAEGQQRTREVWGDSGLGAAWLRQCLCTWGGAVSHTVPRPWPGAWSHNFDEN